MKTKYFNFFYDELNKLECLKSRKRIIFDFQSKYFFFVFVKFNDKFFCEQFFAIWIFSEFSIENVKSKIYTYPLWVGL